MRWVKRPATSPTSLTGRAEKIAWITLILGDQLSPTRLPDPSDRRLGLLVAAPAAPFARLVSEWQPARQATRAFALLASSQFDDQFTRHAYNVGVPWARVEPGAALGLAVLCYRSRGKLASVTDRAIRAFSE